MGIGHIISWLVFGLIVGAIGRFLVPGRNPMGCLATSLLGIVGSVLGGLLAYGLKFGTDVYSPGGWIMSIIGAVIALLIFRNTRRA